jgi:hypothetical protein
MPIGAPPPQVVAMPEAAAVVVYEGKRARTFRVKYRDAAGKQVMETVGKASDGWTRRKAEGELRTRLVAVEKEGLGNIEPITFGTFADEFLATYPDAKALKLDCHRVVPTVGILLRA